MSELSPTQVALRELMILTKCYCGNYGEDPHPRLGHNCSFRRDVLTLVTNIGAALELCDGVKGPGELAPDAVLEFAKAVRAALLGEGGGPPGTG